MSEIPDEFAFDGAGYATTGTTSDGLTWRYQDGELPASKLRVIDPQFITAKDWRGEHCHRVLDLFKMLQLPGVEIILDRADPALATRYWTAEDYLPRWEVGQEHHAFLHGITGKLWECLAFSPNSPNSLVQEWVEWHVDLHLDRE